MQELIQVFYEPGKVFDKVREKRIWVAALIAIIVVAIAVSAFLTNAIGYENIVRKQIENNRMTQSLSQEQKEKAIQDSMSPMRKNLQYIAIPIVISILMCIFALLFMAIAAISGSKIAFTQGLGIATYVGWPFSLLNALMSVLIVTLSAEKETLDPQGVVAMNIGAFLDKTTTAKPLFALASSLDLLVLAQIVFAAYALSKVAQISFTKALVGLGAIWVIITLIRIGLSFVF